MPHQLQTTLNEVAALSAGHSKHEHGWRLHTVCFAHLFAHSLNTLCNNRETYNSSRGFSGVNTSCFAKLILAHNSNLIASNTSHTTIRA